MTQSIPKPVTIGKYLDGIYPSLALIAGMQLDLFSAIGTASCSAEEIAGQLDVSAEKLRFLLYALVAAELLTCADDRFANTPETAFYLVKGSPGYFADIHTVIRPMWQAAFLTAETIRTGEPQFHVEYDVDEMDEDEMVAFAGMHKLSLMSVRNLTRKTDFSRHKNLADIGGGTGGLAIGLTQAFPELQATILDLPSVTPLTHKFVGASPVKDRIKIVASNIVENPLDGEYDAVTMRAFTQVLPADAVQAALANTAQGMVSGASLYIIAQTLDDSRYEPGVIALSNLAFLSLYDGGQAYTESEYRAWLEKAGFGDVERQMLTYNDTLITAIRR